MTNDNIAVEMLKDAFDDAFDTAPVEAVRSCFPAKRVESAAFLAMEEGLLLLDTRIFALFS